MTKYARAGKPIGKPDKKDLDSMAVGLVAGCTLEEALCPVANHIAFLFCGERRQ